MQRVPEEELKVAKTSEILDGLSSRNKTNKQFLRYFDLGGIDHSGV